MPSSDDDTDPLSPQTTAPPEDESSAKRRSAEAPTDPGPRARMKTASGLGEPPVAPVNYKPPTAYSSEEIKDLLNAFVQVRPQFPPIKTAFSNGLRAASYAAQPHAVHGGVDTLPPDEGVIVTIPEEITQPPARRPQDNTTVDLPPIPKGLERRGVRIAIALVAAISIVIGVGFVMKAAFQTADMIPATSSMAPAGSSRAVPTATNSALPSAVVATAEPAPVTTSPSGSTFASSSASAQVRSTVSSHPSNPPAAVNPSAPHPRRIAPTLPKDSYTP